MSICKEFKKLNVPLVERCLCPRTVPTQCPTCQEQSHSQDEQQSSNVGGGCGCGHSH